MSNYQRYLDIHITANDGWYEFGNQIGSQGNYVVEKHDFDGGYLSLVTPKDPKEECFLSRSPTPNQLPDNGFIATCATVAEVSSSDWPANIVEEPTNDLEKLIKWVSNIEYRGKIRINAHGYAEGIGMNDSFGKKQTTVASDLVSWLKSYGLKTKKSISSVFSHEKQKGVATICLAVCYGGLSRSSLADSSPATNIGRGLNSEGIKGVKVTGSPFKISKSPSEETIAAEAVKEIEGWSEKKIREEIWSILMNETPKTMPVEFLEKFRDPVNFGRLTVDELDHMDDEIINGGKISFVNLKKMWKDNLARDYKERIQKDYGPPGQIGHSIPLKNGRKKWQKLGGSSFKQTCFS